MTLSERLDELEAVTPEQLKQLIAVARAAASAIPVEHMHFCDLWERFDQSCYCAAHRKNVLEQALAALSKTLGQ